LEEYQFELSPVSVPDGRGIIAKTLKDGVQTLHYLPVDMPLYNVLNAWQFIHSAEELDMFQKQYGLFRPTYYEQLYSLYETENYNRTSPGRPYLVTTDIFWEIFAVAYEGIFILREKEQAIPNFWKFIDEADNYFKTNNKTSKWNKVFTTLKDLKANRTSNAEVARILSETDSKSEITGEEYAYSDLKPRGHYTSDDMKLYFRAFRYFTTILSDTKELENMPTNISQYAVNWINTYSEFIAPSRGPSVWKNIKTTIPAYCQYPTDSKSIFPFSWGFDNEVLHSTVFHSEFPDDIRVEGRLLPSGVDIAAVMGNGLAENLMADEYTQYPPLRKVITNLRSNYQKHSGSADFKSTLYNQWMNAMAVQWSDLNTANKTPGTEIWQVKRLQTGLATWACLRHATVLVNERTCAECGEGGFEEMLFKTPRGAVEADPTTFRTVADMFRELQKTTSTMKTKETQDIYNGVISWLENAIEESMQFADMAEKEQKGEKLTNEEYEKIFYVARVAEHLFKVFNSLQSNDEYGLSNPDPMAKIADVAGGDGIYLMAAIGNPLEWDFIVPYYGRNQIVKGSIYSYYEFGSSTLLDDDEWRNQAPKQEILPWIKPYVYSYPNPNYWGLSNDTGY